VAVQQAAKLYAARKIDYSEYIRLLEENSMFEKALEKLGNLGQNEYRKGKLHAHEMDAIYACAEAMREDKELMEDSAQETMDMFEKFLDDNLKRQQLTNKEYDLTVKRLAELKERTRMQSPLDKHLPGTVPDPSKIIVSKLVPKNNYNTGNTPTPSASQAPPLTFKDLDETLKKLQADKLARARRTVQKFTPQKSQTLASGGKHNVLAETRTAPGGTEEVLTLMGGWEIAASDEKLVIRSAKTQKTLLAVTHEGITVGEEDGENITLGETK